MRFTSAQKIDGFWSPLAVIDQVWRDPNDWLVNLDAISHPSLTARNQRCKADGLSRSRESRVHRGASCPVVGLYWFLWWRPAGACTLRDRRNGQGALLRSVFLSPWTTSGGNATTGGEVVNRDVWKLIIIAWRKQRIVSRRRPRYFRFRPRGFSQRPPGDTEGSFAGDSVRVRVWIVDMGGDP